MLTGTVLAQALPLLAAPLLTRLYSPEAFGLLTLFMGVAGSLAVLATCRMDLAVVLPKSDERAKETAGFAIITTLIVCTLTVVVLATLVISGAVSFPASWIWVVPTMIALLASYQLASGLATRNQSFRRIATASVINQACYVVTSIAIGAVSSVALGLVFARTLGQLLASLMLGHGVIYDSFRSVGKVSWVKATGIFKEFKQFFIFNTPYSLIGSVARDAPIYIFSAFSALGAAGYFGLARTVLMAPTLLASNAFSQVFYREAVALKGTVRLEAITLNLLRIGFITLAPIFAFCTVWGDHLFVFVFGERWHTSGQLAMALAPAAWLAIQTGWPERLFEVNQRQGVSFGIQLLSDALTTSMVAAVYLVTENVIYAIIMFSLCNVAYHHLYLITIFRISSFRVSGLATVMYRGWAMYIVVLLLLSGLRLYLDLSTPLGWGSSAVIAVTISLASMKILTKKDLLVTRNE